MSKPFRYFLTTLVILGLLAVLLAAAAPRILKAYIETGIGTCRSMPLLCAVPSRAVALPAPVAHTGPDFITHRFPGLQIVVPRHFTLIKERIRKAYYRKKQFIKPNAVIYLLQEKPNFFINLFPQVATQGVYNNYDFLAHTMRASLDNLHSLEDAFFVVMKSIFTPAMGDQKQLRIVAIQGGSKQGFITYNLSPTVNYFDCNIVDARGNFFKICIHDQGATLDLEKVLQIVSTLQKTPDEI